MFLPPNFGNQPNSTSPHGGGLARIEAVLRVTQERLSFGRLLVHRALKGPPHAVVVRRADSSRKRHSEPRTDSRSEVVLLDRNQLVCGTEIEFASETAGVANIGSPIGFFANNSKFGPAFTTYTMPFSAAHRTLPSAAIREE